MYIEKHPRKYTIKVQTCTMYGQSVIPLPILVHLSSLLVKIHFSYFHEHIHYMHSSRQWGIWELSFISHHESILLIDMHEVCVYIGHYYHIIAIHIVLRHPPSKDHNIHSSLDHTSHYSIGDQTSLSIVSKTLNNA